MYEEVPPYRVKRTVFANGERCPLVVDAAGVLAWDANQYGTAVLRVRGRSSGTMEQHLRAIVLLLNWAASRERPIDLRVRLTSLQVLDHLEVADLRKALRHRRRAGARTVATDVVSAGVLYNRCHMVREYLKWHADLALQRLPVGDARHAEARHRVEMLERSLVAGLPKQAESDVEGLDDAGRRLFLDAITPNHPLNPFKKVYQHRNQALMLLYYETGVRRAEALLLKGQHLVNLHGDHPLIQVRRSPDDPAETRGEEPRAKTNERDIPVSHELAMLLRGWIIDHRSDKRRFGYAKRTPFVFVSRFGAPLSLRQVNNIFGVLRKRVPGLPHDFHTHVARYTANDLFSEHADATGLGAAKEQQLRNYLMGWSKTSTQGERYTRRHVRTESDRVMRALQAKSKKGRNR